MKRRPQIQVHLSPIPWTTRRGSHGSAFVRRHAHRSRHNLQSRSATLSCLGRPFFGRHARRSRHHLQRRSGTRTRVRRSLFGRHARRSWHRFRAGVAHADVGVAHEWYRRSQDSARGQHDRTSWHMFQSRSGTRRRGGSARVVPTEVRIALGGNTPAQAGTGSEQEWHTQTWG